MINKNLINILLLSLSICTLLVVVLPAYNGEKGVGTFNVLNMSGMMQSYYKNKNVSNSLKTATELKTLADSYNLKYQNISSNTADDYMTKIAEAIPDKKDIVRNINTLAAQGVKSKLKLSDFKFTKPSGNPKDKSNKKTHEVSFNISGNYYDLTKFLEKLEYSLEIYNIKSLNITSTQSDSLENTLKYALTLETYENTR